MRWTHIEHLAGDPDGVFRAQVVLDTRGIDAGGGIVVRHLDGRVGQSSRSPGVGATRYKVQARLARKVVADRGLVTYYIIRINYVLRLGLVLPDIFTEIWI